MDRCTEPTEGLRAATGTGRFSYHWAPFPVLAQGYWVLAGGLPSTM
jgi:hypothetical protein